MAALLVLAVVVAVRAGAAAPTPKPWVPVSVDKHRGRLDARLSYERRKAGFGAYSFRDMQLVVKVSGKAVFAGRLCSQQRCSVASHHRLFLSNVWGDSLPEVILDTYTGGAHCCFESFIVLADGPHPGRAISHDWGDPGYRLVTHAGMRQFVTGDDRFAYAFTSFAGSALPVVVDTIDANGVLQNVTQTRLDLVRSDARQWLKAYTSQRGKPDADIRGVLAGWCADEYRLGLKSECDTELSSAVAKSYLSGPPGWPAGARYVTFLHKQLARWGYPASPSH